MGQRKKSQLKFENILHGMVMKILYSKLKEKPQSTEDIFNKSKQCNKNKQLKIVRGFKQFRLLKPNG